MQAVLNFSTAIGGNYQTTVTLRLRWPIHGVPPWRPGHGSRPSRCPRGVLGLAWKHGATPRHPCRDSLGRNDGWQA